MTFLFRSGRYPPPSAHPLNWEKMWSGLSARAVAVASSLGLACPYTHLLEYNSDSTVSAGNLPWIPLPPKKPNFQVWPLDPLQFGLHCIPPYSPMFTLGCLWHTGLAVIPCTCRMWFYPYICSCSTALPRVPFPLLPHLYFLLNNPVLWGSLSHDLPLLKLLGLPLISQVFPQGISQKSACDLVFIFYFWKKALGFYIYI